jgi:hypothetical protein
MPNFRRCGRVKAESRRRRWRSGSLAASVAVDHPKNQTLSD